MIKIRLNGEDRELKEEMTICDLIASLNVPCGGTAVAIDGEIIHQNQHGTRKVKNGDVVEVIRAIGGG